MIGKRIGAALGKTKADVVLKNGSYVNVFTGEVERGDIAITGGRIVGIGTYSGEREIDIGGKIAVPGLIDAHVHIESSQLSPEEYARLVVPHGTTAIIADPHEIANVCGISGVRYIADAARNTPLDVKVMLPSCVPATPFETSGATLSGADTERYIGEPYVWGLGEFMNAPGVLNGDADVLRKLEAAHACGKVVDGHAPDLSGQALNAYIAAGIQTDHECATPEEAAEKVAKGMYVHLREGSATRNVAAVGKAVNEKNFRRFLFCTDDRHAADLKARGHINNALRVAVAAGMDPVRAVTIATLNAAECYRLCGKGAIAPSFDADIAVFDDLKEFRCALVLKGGKTVAERGAALFDTGKKFLPDAVRNTVHLATVAPSQFCMHLKGERALAMRLTEGSVVTEKRVCTVASRGGDVALAGTDLLKLAVIERHRGTGNIGLGLLEGYGMHGGALALTVAHDSHNLIVLGDNNEDMAAAANELVRIGGGLALAKGGSVQSLPLDIAGLMSSLPAEEYIARSERLYEEAYSMGVKRGFDAFMSLSFLALLVIPSLRLSDKGLFDVEKFALVGIDAE